MQLDRKSGVKTGVNERTFEEVIEGSYKREKKVKDIMTFRGNYLHFDDFFRIFAIRKPPMGGERQMAKG